jgi:DNA-binding MarR family transcriptional regulator
VAATAVSETTTDCVAAVRGSTISRQTRSASFAKASSSYSLSEARIIFDVAKREATEVSDLRRRLDVAAGYLSCVPARFASDGSSAGSDDGRPQVIRLTESGRSALSMLDEPRGDAGSMSGWHRCARRK